MDLKTIGITGGIGSGKSTVARILIEMGFTVISSDAIAHALMEKGQKAYAEVVDYFGFGILESDGRINRRTLGAIVFKDDSSRAKLEQIVHPLVMEDIRKQMDGYARSGLRVLFVEVPLLFETGMEDMFDEVWVVSASCNEQVKRLTHRDNLSQSDIRERISAQMPLEEKESRADRIIENNCGLVELKKQVCALLDTLELI